ncbi:MAG: GNAT family N-acetyltransferase [Lachnospiraceae bacterium]|nr:GNAT family N-acetyltransferase [Lachnospiraceae bacterium]
MEDYDRILELYSRARRFMKETGNPTQWSDNWPPVELIKEDIEKGDNLVCEKDGIIHGVFAYFQGLDIDPTYLVIEDGAWLKEGEYGVVHRLAGSGEEKGVAEAALNWSFAQCHHLRVDTHADNKVTQTILEKLGFVRTGIIYVKKDNSPRIAYEKV